MKDCKHPPSSIGVHEPTARTGYCNDCKRMVYKRNYETHSEACEKCGCPMVCKLVGDEYHCVCNIKTCNSCGWETIKTLWFTP